MKIKNLFLLPLFLFAMSLSGCKNNKSGGEGEGGGETVHVTSVSLDKTELTLAAGEKATLKATVSPSSATNKEVKWSVDNNHVTVSNGEVTAVSEGESIVTVTTVDSNKTATCKVTVSKAQTVAVQSVILSANSNEVLVNKTLTISATIEPSNATNKNLIWESSLESVATVDKNGVVTGVAAGEVTISAKAEENENISDSITITVKESVVSVPVESVAFTKQSETITKGFATYLSYEISPSNATNKAVTWDSSNKEIATVNDAGLVTGVAAGESDITITTVDGNKTATIKVTVTEEETTVTNYLLVGEVKYELSLNESAALVEGQSAEYMALGIEVEKDDQVTYYLNSELVSKFGPSVEHSETNYNNGVGSDEEGYITIQKSGTVDAFIQVYEDGGTSYWITGGEEYVAPTTVQITFNINYNTQYGEAVFLLGTFNGWQQNNTDYRLTPGDNGNWSGTFEFEVGLEIEYKFVIGPWDGVGINTWEGGENRTLTVSEATTIDCTWQA